jgi:hypothetical protein
VETQRLWALSLAESQHGYCDVKYHWERELLQCDREWSDELGKTYWMLVTTQENLDITRARGFSMQGIDTKNRKKAVQMGPEDRVLYYVSDRKGFAATATVTSESFEDDEPIWKHHREQETFPHRVEIDADVVLDQANYVNGYQIGPTLEYVKKWAPDRWPLAFFGMLPQRDFNFVEGELRRAGEFQAPVANTPEPEDPPVADLNGLAERAPTKRLFSASRKSGKSSHRRRQAKHR